MTQNEKAIPPELTKNQVRSIFRNIDNPRFQQELLRFAGTSRENFSFILRLLLDPDNFLGIPGTEKRIHAIEETLVVLEEVRRTFDEAVPNFISVLFAAFVNPDLEKYEKNFHQSVLTRRSVSVANVLSRLSSEKQSASFLYCFVICACIFKSDPIALYPLVGRLFVDSETNCTAMWALVTKIADTNTPLSKFEQFFEALAEADIETVTKNLSTIYYAKRGSPETKKIAESILVQLSKKPEFLQRILRTLLSCSTRRELYTLILNSTPEGQAHDIRTRKEGPSLRHNHSFDKTDYAKYRRRLRRSS